MAEKQSEPSPAPAVLRIETPQDLQAAVEQAFDYRGDVTIELKDGQSIEGYVFNRTTAGTSDAYLEYYPKNADEQRRVPLTEIQSIALTGADPAAGRSWETWVRMSQEKKKAEAEGRDIGNIEPEALPLDD